MDVFERLEIASQWAPRILSREALGYVVLAGLAWGLFDHLLHRWTARRKINQRAPEAAQMRREFFYSLRSVCIFAVVGGFMVFAIASGWTKFYMDFEKHGLGWFLISIGLLTVAHDTWFYWTHRLMHHPFFFKWIHRLHHQSINTTPWATYSFTATEAVIQAISTPLMIFLIPIHPGALAIFALWRHVFSVMGHAGYEIFPAGFFRWGFGRILNTPTHHVQHHTAFRSNFGLYFNVWDRLMGTNHPDYEAVFEEVTNRPKSNPQIVEPGLLSVTCDAEA